MTVIRQYNPSTAEWEIVAVGQAGPQGVTGPTGATGATGPRQHVGTLPPASPTAGDQWFNSELGRQFVYYDSTWVEVGAAFRGDPGLVASASAPTDTSVLWLDTDEEADGWYLPAGGSSGAVLRKASGANYDTEWAGNVVTADGITAKGDILSGSAAGAVTTTAAGSAGQVLSVDLAQPGGLAWRTIPAGDQLIVYPNTVDPINLQVGSTSNLLDTAFAARGVCLLRAAVISSMSVYINTTSGGGALYRMAIYGNDGYGRPGNLLWASDPLDGSTGGAKTASGINTLVPAGMIYVTAMSIAGTINVYGNGGSTAGNDAAPKGAMGDNLSRGGRYYAGTTGGAAPSNPTWTLGNGGGSGVALQFSLTFSQVIQ